MFFLLMYAWQPGLKLAPSYLSAGSPLCYSCAIPLLFLCYSSAILCRSLIASSPMLPRRRGMSRPQSDPPRSNLHMIP